MALSAKEKSPVSMRLLPMGILIDLSVLRLGTALPSTTYDIDASGWASGTDASMQKTQNWT